MDVHRSPTRDPEEWLELAPDFSRPFCQDLRACIHAWEPDLTESIKWNALCFSGRKLVCGLDACRRHAGFTFFRGAELPDSAALLSGAGVSIRSLKLKSLVGLDRPALRRLLHAAVLLDDQPPLPRLPNPNRQEFPVPDFLVAAFQRHPAAALGFQNLAPTYQREYLVWLTHAKRPETRARRLAETLAALADSRKWIDRKR